MDGGTGLWIVGVAAFAGVVALAVWSVPKLRIELQRRREFRRRSQAEDVLKHVFTRQTEGGEASIDSLAGHLGLSARKLLRRIMEMEAAGVLRSESGRLRLTEAGEKLAVQVVRAHRLWETYLAHEARMPMSKVHGQAERQEHRLLADKRVDELDAFLGHPRSDPHGDPIPTASGDMAALGAQPLTNWPQGVPAEIVHVEDEPEPILRQISEQGLKPGSTVEITGQTPELLTIRDGEKQYRLPPLVAGNIQVVPATGREGKRESLVRLSDLKPGEAATIALLDEELRGFTRRRLLDLGLTPNSEIAVQLANAFGDPLAFRVRGTTIALRREQASKIWVKKIAEPAAASQAARVH